MQHLSKIDDASLMSNFRLWPALVPQYKAALKNYTMRKTEDVLMDIATFDLRSKGVGNTNVEEGALLKELISKILYE
jgi:DNA polymerase-3 subunit delta